MSLFVVNARFLTQEITGVQRFAIEICRQLKNKLQEVIFVSPQNVKHNNLAKELAVKRVGKFSGHYWEQIELPLFLKNLPENPILLNLANTAPIFYKNKIVTVHDVAFMHNPKWFSKKFFYFYRFLIPRILKDSRKVFTVSEFSKMELIKYFDLPESKIKVIYNAISAEDPSNSDNTLSGKPSPENYILAVSSLDPRKNLNLLISAFKEINQANLSLVLVGKENKKVFSKINFNHSKESDNNIFFTGYISDLDLKKKYSNAKIFVYPSLYEGFGLPPLEAMYNGCPVITSNTASMPEICGDAALYFDPMSKNDLIEKLLRLLNNADLRLELINKGYKRINKYSWSDSVKKIIESIDQKI